MNRRTEILEACYRLIAEEGIQGLSQPRVAQAVGLKQGHLTYYFPTRIDLLRAVAEMLMTEAFGPLVAATGKSQLTREAVARLLASRVGDARTSRFMLAMSTMAQEDEAIRDLVVGFEKDVSTGLGELMKSLPGGAPISGEALHAIMIGLAVQSLTMERKEAVKLVNRVLTEALGVSSPTKSK